MISRRTVLVVSIAALVLALASTASAGGRKSTSSSLSLVVLGTSGAASAQTAAGAHWGDSVTFDVSTTATDKPSVKTNCYQNGTLVYTQFGFFYPAPTSPTFTLRSYVWTGAAADCTAELYSVNPAKGTSTTLATTNFHVDA
jgi:hypothetical protein